MTPADGGSHSGEGSQPPSEHAIIGVLSNGLVLMNVPFFYQLVVKGVVIVLAVGIGGLKNFKRAQSRSSSSRACGNRSQTLYGRD